MTLKVARTKVTGKIRRSLSRGFRTLTQLIAKCCCGDIGPPPPPFPKCGDYTGCKQFCDSQYVSPKRYSECCPCPCPDRKDYPALMMTIPAPVFKLDTFIPFKTSGPGIGSSPPYSGFIKITEQQHGPPRKSFFTNIENNHGGWCSTDLPGYPPTPSPGQTRMVFDFYDDDQVFVRGGEEHYANLHYAAVSTEGGKSLTFGDSGLPLTFDRRPCKTAYAYMAGGSDAGFYCWLSGEPDHYVYGPPEDMRWIPYVEAALYRCDGNATLVSPMNKWLAEPVVATVTATCFGCEPDDGPPIPVADIFGRVPYKLCAGSMLVQVQVETAEDSGIFDLVIGEIPSAGPCAYAGNIDNVDIAIAVRTLNIVGGDHDGEPYSCPNCDPNADDDYPEHPAGGCRSCADTYWKATVQSFRNPLFNPVAHFEGGPSNCPTGWLHIDGSSIPTLETSFGTNC
jgi:hypothetical protein